MFWRQPSHNDRLALLNHLIAIARDIDSKLEWIMCIVVDWTELCKFVELDLCVHSIYKLYKFGFTNNLV